MITWVIVANTNKAKIFAMNKLKFLNDKDKLVLVKELSHPESRMHDAEIVSDKPGRYRAKNSAGDSFNQPTDPRKHEIDNFAHELVKELETGRSNNSFRDIILVVAPAFYGLINARMHPQLKNLVSLIIEKDYVKENDRILAKHLKQQIG